MKARHFQALPPARSVLSRELRRNGPVRWEWRRALATSETCRVRYYSQYCQLSAIMGATSPRGEHCPVPNSGWRCARVGTSSAPLRWPTHKKASTHAQSAPRRTLSFTIASQTIASSPDGSESSSAASSACGTPAAAVGGGRRFRASSTVTSSSNPCNHTFGHSAACALEHAGDRGKARSADGSAFLAVYCPVCTPVAVHP
jgi:hypothetical protein